MHLKLLTLNINADNFLANVITHLQENDYDIIQLQEIAGENTFTGNIHCTVDCYPLLEEALQDRYSGIRAIAERYTSSPTSYLGNAIFYKKSFTLKSQHLLWLHRRTEPFSSEE